MTRKSAIHGLKPVHPGELLREDILPAVGRPKTEIAALLGISRQHLYDILNERKPVSPAVALRLGKLFGNGPDLWLGLQSEYDLRIAETQVDTSRIPTLKVA